MKNNMIDLNQGGHADPKQETSNIKHGEETRRRHAISVEFLMWMFLSVVPTIFAYMRYSIAYGGHYSRGEQIELILPYSGISIIIFIFPIFFKSVFGYLPLAYQRYKRELRAQRNAVAEANANKSAFVDQRTISEDELVNTVFNKVKHEIEGGNPVSLLGVQIQESDDIASRIFTRGNSYLVAGGTIAIVGVIGFLFFNTLFSLAPKHYNEFEPSSQDSVIMKTDTLKPETVKTELMTGEANSQTSYYLNFFHRLSVLLIIEVLAFFFLRQYRVMIEEYRYYEAVKRSRQNNLLIINLINDPKINPKSLKLILDHCNFNTDGVKLAANETTPTLESQKIKDDNGLVEKLLEAVKEFKTTK